MARTKGLNLILLDIMLPRIMNGFEFLKILSKEEKLKDIAVIVLTNLDSEKQGAEKHSMVRDCLIKANTDLEKLVEMVKKYTS